LIAGGYRKRHDLVAAGCIADRQRTEFFDFLDAHDALHRQMQHLRVLELVAQALLGRIDDDAIALLENQLADLGESPQRTAANVARVQLQGLALAQECHFV
jgi:heme oxygenase